MDMCITSRTPRTCLFGTVLVTHMISVITASRALEETTSNPSPPSYPLHPSYAPLQSQVRVNDRLQNIYTCYFVCVCVCGDTCVYANESVENASLPTQVCSFISPAERNWRDYLSEKNTIADIPYNQNPYTSRWDTGTPWTSLNIGIERIF